MFIKCLLAYVVFSIVLVCLLPLCIVKSQRELWMLSYYEVDRLQFNLLHTLKNQYKTMFNKW